ncbi:MAG: dihydrodipicolinate synthase family protein [Anaerotruncus colihominis]
MTRKEFTAKYGRILLPLVTPFGKDEEIDYKVYGDLIEYLIKNDLCDSLIVTGTTGEASLLTFDERVRLMETAVRVSAGRKPVIAGTGCASTKETAALTKKAAELGIDLCMIVCPFYNKPTQQGVYNHYKQIAESVNVNILLYNIPIFVGINIEAQTVHELSEIPNIMASGRGRRQSDPGHGLFSATEDAIEFVIFNGDDIMLLPTIVQGARARKRRRAHLRP